MGRLLLAPGLLGPAPVDREEAAGGLRKEAARSAARRQRLVGARGSVGVAPGLSPAAAMAAAAAAADVLPAASLRPVVRAKLRAAARAGVALLLPLASLRPAATGPAASSVVVLRRRAVMAARPGVAAGCCSSASSEATSCGRVGRVKTGQRDGQLDATGKRAMHNMIQNSWHAHPAHLLGALPNSGGRGRGGSGGSGCGGMPARGRGGRLHRQVGLQAPHIIGLQGRRRLAGNGCEERRSCG